MRANFFALVLIVVTLVACGGAPPTTAIKPNLPMPTLVTVQTPAMVLASSTPSPTWTAAATATRTRLVTPTVIRSVTPTTRPLPPTNTPGPVKTSTPRPASPTPTATRVPQEVIVKKGESILLVQSETGQSMRITFLDYQEGYIPPGYLAGAFPEPFVYRETTNIGRSGSQRDFHLRGPCDPTFFTAPVCGFVFDFLWENREWYGFYFVHSPDGVVRILYPYNWEIRQED